MSEKETKVQSMPQNTMEPAVSQKLNRLSIKFNAKTMLEQEFGEALTEYVNVANQVITELKIQLAKAQEESKHKVKKP